MLRLFLSFFISACLISIPLVLAKEYVFAETYWLFLSAGSFAYVTGLYLDVKSTIFFGAETVRLSEMSPVFKYFARYGFTVAIPMQIIMECGVAFALLPFMLTYEINMGVTGVALCMFGGVHCIGWRSNKKLMSSRAINQKDRAAITAGRKNC